MGNIFRLILLGIIFFLPFIYIIICDWKRLSLGYTLRLGYKDFFALWIAIFGIIGIAIGIFQTAEIISNQEKHFREQTDKQEKQLRDGRFSVGAELLGNSSESARMGGVYNLFFLASEYPDEYKHPVFEILCSHIRTTTSKKDYQETFKEKPSNEIQTILNLLFRNPPYKEETSSSMWVSLENKLSSEEINKRVYI